MSCCAVAETNNRTAHTSSSPKNISCGSWRAPELHRLPEAGSLLVGGKTFLDLPPELYHSDACLLRRVLQVDPVVTRGFHASMTSATVVNAIDETGVLVTTGIGQDGLGGGDRRRDESPSVVEK